MAESRMSVWVAEDRSRAELRLLPASGVSGTVPLTLDQLTTLILRLGQARSEMLAGKPVPPLEGTAIAPVFNTHWVVQPEAATEGSVIAFQHPAFGAVGFVLPPADVEKIVRALAAHLAMVHSKEVPDDAKPS